MTETKRDKDNKRVNRIRKLFDCKTDLSLAEMIGTNQPQIARWRAKGFTVSTANVLDFLLNKIAKKEREIARLQKHIKDLESRDLDQLTDQKRRELIRDFLQDGLLSEILKECAEFVEQDTQSKQ